MDRRLELDAAIRSALGSSNVYFQPPESVHLRYPAVVYSLSSVRETFANDRKYNRRRVYSAILIDPDPDTELLDRMLDIPHSKLVRSFKADNLNHYEIQIAY